MSDLRNGTLTIEGLRALAADLGAEHDKETESALLRLLEAEDPIVRYNAVVASGFDRRMRSAIPFFKSMATQDTDEDCRDAAVSVLGNILQNTNDREVLTILRTAALNDPDETVRRSAYKAAVIVHGLSRDKHLALLQNREVLVDNVILDNLLPSEF